MSTSQFLNSAIAHIEKGLQELKSIKAKLKSQEEDDSIDFEVFDSSSGSDLENERKVVIPRRYSFDVEDKSFATSGKKEPDRLRKQQKRSASFVPDSSCSGDESPKPKKTEAKARHRKKQNQHETSFVLSSTGSSRNVGDGLLKLPTESVGGEPVVCQIFSERGDRLYVECSRCKMTHTCLTSDKKPDLWIHKPCWTRNDAKALRKDPTSFTYREGYRH